jgi:transcriptional regulator with XRE-family HTH domain
VPANDRYRFTSSEDDELTFAQPGALEAIIGAKVREYRTASGRSMADLAAAVGISKTMLSKIENSQTSCSLTTLGRLAVGLGVPITALFRGVDPELDAVFTKAGHGSQIVGRGTSLHHDYNLLGALRGAHKRMEATLVTLTEESGTYPLFQHPGTEILYVLEGVIVYGHGDNSYEMHPGDALQFDGEAPHGPERIIALPIRFLSVIAYGDLVDNRG